MANHAPLKKPGGNVAAKSAPKMPQKPAKPAGKAQPKADPKKTGERLKVWMA